MSIRRAIGDESLWRNRDFRRYFVGTFVTNVGDSLYSVAILWLVFELSGSTFLTGIANALLLLPFMLQIVAGPIVDRVALKPLLVGTQVVQGVVVLVIPIAAYTDTLSVWLLIAMIPVLSMVTLLSSPITTTLVPRIVEEESLSSANSALATVSLGLDMIFDAMGGVFIALFGATALFIFDSVTFAIATVLFLGMVIPHVDPEARDGQLIGDYLSDLRDGVDLLRGTLFVELLVTSAIANFAIGIALALLPAFGSELGGPAIYGFLLGALGVGRLIGSASAPYLEGVPFGQLLAVGYTLAASLWLASVYAPTTVLTVGLFGLAWITGGIDGVLTQTVNQRVFDAEVLGRISAIKGTAAGTTLPIGSLVGGYVGDVLGTQTTLGMAAAGFAIVGLWIALRGPLRRLPAVVDIEKADLGVDNDGDRSLG